MAEHFISKRIIFPRGQQKLFLITVKNKLKITNKALAELLKIHIRTLTDWKREKFLIPLSTARYLSKFSGITLPNKIQIRNKYEDIKKAARLGGLAIIKKYGGIPINPDIRKQKWRIWWEQKGKFSPFLNKRKSIVIPQKTDQLAEFVGIMLGDGGISSRQVVVTLNKKDDFLYSRFVINLIKNLFGITPSVYVRQKEQTLRIVVSRTNLVAYCEKIGLKIGNKLKQGLDIPQWIKKNKSFTKTCLRGLIDTDGCLVIHKYTVNGKTYMYKKLQFVSASPFLIASVKNIFINLNFKPRIARDKRRIWLDNSNEVKEYMTVICTNNPKHRERFSFHGEVPKRLKGRVC